MRRSVRPAKSDRDVELAAGHHEHIWRVVHDLIESYEREAEGHELDDRSQSDHGRADTESGETVFADRSIDDPFRPEPLEQPLAHFVSTLVFRHVLAHQKTFGSRCNSSASASFRAWR